MKCGKLPVDILKSCVFDNIGVRRPEVLVHAGIGEDCSVIDFGSHCCVLSTDPITGTGSGIGRLAVHINCNDIAASGVEPLGILVTILAPESVKAEDIADIMKEINAAASGINVEILGGHTEVTDAVNRLIVSVTAVGRGGSSRFITTSGAKNGDFIIVSKYIGLEGTSIIAADYSEYLSKKLDAGAIKRAKGFADMISVLKEGMIGAAHDVSSMHDATEGGLLGALWEIAEASEKGFEIYHDQIPVTDETLAICDVMQIDPLRLISSGMMVMTARDGEAIVAALLEQGINAACIGRIVEDKNRRIIVNNRLEETVAPPENDELFNINIK